MPKKQLVDLVNKMKKSGVKVGFTKPKSNLIQVIPSTKKTNSLNQLRTI